MQIFTFPLYPPPSLTSLLPPAPPSTWPPPVPECPPSSSSAETPRGSASSVSPSPPLPPYPPIGSGDLCEPHTASRSCTPECRPGHSSLKCGLHAPCNSAPPPSLLLLLFALDWVVESYQGRTTTGKMSTRWPPGGHSSWAVYPLSSQGRVWVCGTWDSPPQAGHGLGAAAAVLCTLWKERRV